MRILGIDPGLRVTGFGVIDAEGARLRYVASGVIRIGTGSLPPRLKTIHDGIAGVVAEYRPDSAVAEIVFVNVNPQSTLLLGQARGAAIGALVAHGLPVHEYTALQVKQAVVGYGRAAKSQVQQMVQRLLALPGVPSTDAADALACAICHAHAATMSAAAAAIAARSSSAGVSAARSSPAGAGAARSSADDAPTAKSSPAGAPTAKPQPAGGRRLALRRGRLRLM